MAQNKQQKTSSQQVQTPEPQEPIFSGETENERRINALLYDRMANIMERFGQQLTPTEQRTIQYLMMNLYAKEEGEPEKPGAPTE